MNLHFGRFLGVGVNRTPAPAAAPEPAVRTRLPLVSRRRLRPRRHDRRRSPAPRLDAAFFADRQRVAAMVAHWSRDDLYRLGNTLVGEGDRRIEGELLEVLRTMCAREPGQPPVTRVEFVTDANYDDQVYWDDEAVYLHDQSGGEPVPFDFEALEEGSEQAALDERFRDLLADYARSYPPGDGDHLVVNLATGAFEHSGKWSLV
ncbi:hypothetical protein ACFYZ8_33295 [Streptomyces sp. NPDC001668]|uniref:hypothetical protein n=1 Tax=Streptomyces sp. NPDC001668 TaxID=3364598 RepID=UPI0036B498F3